MTTAKGNRNISLLTKGKDIFIGWLDDVCNYKSTFEQYRFNIYFFILFYNLMSILQKIINLIALVVSVGILYQINSNLSNESKVGDQILLLSQAIGKGQFLSDSHLETLASVLANNAQLNNKSPICFLQAYSEVVVKQSISPQNIFNIFEAGNQFSGITKCEHYYSLLMYRASASQHEKKNKILQILDGLFANKLTKDVKESPICVYFYAFNSQVTAKQQTSQIIAQEYQHFSASIQVDSAADNTFMFTKYTLEQSKDKQNSKRVQVGSEKQRRGFLSTLANVIDNKCPQAEIVLVLDKNSVLLSRHSLSLINQQFSKSEAQVLIFKSLTIKHSNIENNLLSDFANSYPVLAFRKSAYSKFKTLGTIKEIQQNSSFNDYQHQVFTYNVLKILQKSHFVGYVDQAIVYRPSRNQTEQQHLGNVLVKSKK